MVAKQVIGGKGTVMELEVRAAEGKGTKLKETVLENPFAKLMIVCLMGKHKRCRFDRIGEEIEWGKKEKQQSTLPV